MVLPNVDHRTGGLENKLKLHASEVFVDHRTGGLETKLLVKFFCFLVDHRTGGLENQVPNPKPT